MINDKIADKITQKLETPQAEGIQMDAARLVVQVNATLAAYESDAADQILDKVRSRIDKRIFEDGLDSYMRQIGIYSEEYAKKRRERGLSGGRVVLIWTGQMRDAMYLLDGEEVTVEFEGQFAADKSRWVQKTYFTDIFDLTDDEEMYMNELIDETAEQLINGS